MQFGLISFRATNVSGWYAVTKLGLWLVVARECSLHGRRRLPLRLLFSCTVLLFIFLVCLLLSLASLADHWASNIRYLAVRVFSGLHVDRSFCNFYHRHSLFLNIRVMHMLLMLLNAACADFQAASWSPGSVIIDTVISRPALAILSSTS